MLHYWVQRLFKIFMHILFQFSNCQVVHLGPHSVKLVPRLLAFFYLLLLYNMHTITRFQKHISILYILYVTLFFVTSILTNILTKIRGLQNRQLHLN